MYALQEYCEQLKQKSIRQHQGKHTRERAAQSAPPLRCLMCGDPYHDVGWCPRVPQGMLEVEREHLMHALKANDRPAVDGILGGVQRRLEAKARPAGPP